MAHTNNTLSATPLKGNGAGEPHTLSVTGFLEIVGEAVRDALPEDVLLAGHVLEVRVRPRVVYLELVEACSADPGNADSVTCVLYPDTLAAFERQWGYSLNPMCLKGTDAVFRVRAKFSGSFKLQAHVRAINPNFVQGGLANMLAGTTAHLEADGVFAQQRKLPWPSYIRRVVVVHPPEAAGFGDIAGELSVLADAGVVSFDTIPCAFEGPSARKALVAALAKADALARGTNPPDIVMIVRGGGATAGFAALNDEEVVRAIGRMSIPVLTGIGHARDLTLADRAAWRSTDTPSKALELVKRSIRIGAEQALADRNTICKAALRCTNEAGRSVDLLKVQITQKCDRYLRLEASALDLLRSGSLRSAASGLNQLSDQAVALDRAITDVNRLVMGTLRGHQTKTNSLYEEPRRAAVAVLTRAQAQASQCHYHLSTAVQRHLKEEERSLGATISALRAALPEAMSFAARMLDRLHKDVRSYGPDAILKRGFSLAHTQAGVTIGSAAIAANAGEFFLSFADGALTVRVLSAEPTT